MTKHKGMIEIKVKGLIDEDFVNYKLPAMFIPIGYCNWKCCIEADIPITVCQNSELAKYPEIEVSIETLYQRYIQNPITKAIVFGGLEPFSHYDDIFRFIEYFRSQGCDDDIVIYTGFYPKEIATIVKQLKDNYHNIIIKFGRYIPNQQPRYDEVLGVNLISDNQYAVKIC